MQTTADHVSIPIKDIIYEMIPTTNTFTHIITSSYEWVADSMSWYRRVPVKIEGVKRPSTPHHPSYNAAPLSSN